MITDEHKEMYKAWAGRAYYQQPVYIRVPDMHTYEYRIDNIIFRGHYVIENPDDGEPIYSITTVKADSITNSDLMLVIDPRIVHEIEANLLEDYRWNL